MTDYQKQKPNSTIAWIRNNLLINDNNNVMEFINAQTKWSYKPTNIVDWMVILSGGPGIIWHLNFHINTIDSLIPTILSPICHATLKCSSTTLFNFISLNIKFLSIHNNAFSIDIPIMKSSVAQNSIWITNPLIENTWCFLTILCKLANIFILLRIRPS